MSEKSNINYIIGRKKQTEGKLAKRSGWEALALEIISQAIKDYKSKYTSRIELLRIRDFFNSEWFGRISTLDPGYILKKLDEYRRAHGYIVISIDGHDNTYYSQLKRIGPVDVIRIEKG